MGMVAVIPMTNGRRDLVLLHRVRIGIIASGGDPSHALGMTGWAGGWP
jgi:hypothetical protein